jgi:VWFA-related protein
MKYAVFLFVVCLTATTVLSGQTPAPSQPPPSPSPSPQDIDVIRVSTELVQTDVMVVDKSGRFVDGLQREQFELKVDGKPQPISIFDRVVSGSLKEEQLVSSRNGPPSSTPAVATSATQRGRTVIFFIDDLHLSASSVNKTRKAILSFIEKEMTSSDQIAIASATGQIGFLQQFTDNKAVLRAAIARLNHRPYIVVDMGGSTPMTEYTAIRVDQGDRDAVSYYATQLLKETNVSIPGAGGVGPPAGGPVNQPRAPQPKSFGLTREMAERMVKERAQVMLKQAGAVTINTLAGLESLMRSSAQMPGRKLIFLVSDGFFLNDRNTGFGNKLKQITDAAVRSGAVIYSLDARGLVGKTDVTTNRPDVDGQLSRSNIGELSASQDPLFALAEDTGGRALLNSEAMNGALTRALNETSNYYLLAWRPNEDDQKGQNYKRIEVSIAGRPDLVVKLPRGYLQSQADAETARNDSGAKRANPRETPITAANTPETSAVKGVESDIRNALGAFAPRRALPTMVSVTYLDTPANGPIITASVQAATAALDYGANPNEKAAVDLAGIVLNDQGKPVASFKTQLSVARLEAGQRTDAGVVYNYKTPLAPGLYQVRAAARDQKSGKVGSAQQWIEIPDLSSHRLTLSSLLVGAQVIDTQKQQTAPQVQFSVDRRFKKSSHLSFWVFIYNTLHGTGDNAAPDVTAQVEMFNNGQAIVKTPARKLNTAGITDLQRIPYGGDFSLASLPPGRYDLNVTITDQLAKASVTQQVSFLVE